MLKDDKQKLLWERVIYNSIRNSNLTQEKIARKMGITQSWVSKKLQNIDNLTLGELRQLSRIAGFDICIGEKRNE